MTALSKNQLTAYRQCHRKLWLELRQPELKSDTAKAQSAFKSGRDVGDVARLIYDPEMQGIVIEIRDGGVDAAIRRTSDALHKRRPIFGGGFQAEEAIAFADILLPVEDADGFAWRLVAIKSATSVKEHYGDDIAIQAFAAREAGIHLTSVSVGLIDNSFVYPGDGDYRGVLFESDLSNDASERQSEITLWIKEAQNVLALSDEPNISTGAHCNAPYACGFHEHCSAMEHKAKYPASLLPRIQSKALKQFLGTRPVVELADIPDELLNARQLRVKHQTLSDRCFFDSVSAAAELAAHSLPAYFLDFETIQFSIPIWKGTRPFQQIPFQFSLHKLSDAGILEHHDFLDLSGNDPSQEFAATLVSQCGDSGPVFVYNAGFEATRIRELADRFPELSAPLLAIIDRIVDLLRIAERHYYHPAQRGSWSIKAVLPTIAPELRYDMLDGVQNGGMAMDAFMEAQASATTADRKNIIDRQLRNYCKLDTYALVRIWQEFSGNSRLQL